MPEVDLMAIATSAVADAREEGTIEPAVISGDEPEGIAPVEVVDPAVAVVDPAVKVDPAVIVADPAVKVELNPDGTPKVIAETAEEKALREELGVSQKRSDGKENRIPYSNVKKIAGNAYVRGQAEALNPIAEMLGVKPAEFKAESLKARLDEGTAASARVAEMAPLTEIMESNPERFLTMLAQVHPGYQKYLQPAAVVEQKPVVPVVDANDPMPALDYPIKDATGAVVGMTYSADGMEKRMAWERRQAVKEAKALIDGEFKPIKDARKLEEDQRALEAQDRQLATKIDGMMTDARTNWDGFAANEPAILKVLVDDKAEAVRTHSKMKHDLNSAYRTVMVPIWKAAGELTATERTKIAADARTAALAEVNKLVPSTSVAVPANVKAETVHNGPRRLEDVAREAVRAAGIK